MLVACATSAGGQPAQAPGQQVEIPAPSESVDAAPAREEPGRPSRRCTIAIRLVDGDSVVGEGEATSVSDDSKRAACQLATVQACHLAARADHCPWSQLRIHRVEGRSLGVPDEFASAPWSDASVGSGDSSERWAVKPPRDDLPDAERLRACEAEAYVLGEATYMGQGYGTDDRDVVQRAAMEDLCRSYRETTGRSCAQDELQVVRTSSSMHMRTQAGTSVVEQSITVVASKVLGRASAASPPAQNKRETCRRAIETACRQALGSAACPRDRLRVVTLDGVPPGAGMEYFLSKSDFYAWMQSRAQP